MSSRSALIREIQQLLSGEHADPRAAQGLFLIPVLVETLLHLAMPAEFDTYFLIGSLIAVIPTLGSVAIGKGLLSDRLTIWIPILDIVALVRTASRSRPRSASRWPSRRSGSACSSGAGACSSRSRRSWP